MSLLMEHMIGLTDTAYLGRVGEVELGASALAGALKRSVCSNTVNPGSSTEHS